MTKITNYVHLDKRISKLMNENNDEQFNPSVQECLNVVNERLTVLNKQMRISNNVNQLVWIAPTLWWADYGSFTLKEENNSFVEIDLKFSEQQSKLRKGKANKQHPKTQTVNLKLNTFRAFPNPAYLVAGLKNSNKKLVGVPVPIPENMQFPIELTITEHWNIYLDLRKVADTEKEFVEDKFTISRKITIFGNLFDAHEQEFNFGMELGYWPIEVFQDNFEKMVVTDEKLTQELLTNIPHQTFVNQLTGTKMPYELVADSYPWGTDRWNQTVRYYAATGLVSDYNGDLIYSSRFGDQDFLNKHSHSNDVDIVRPVGLVQFMNDLIYKYSYESNTEIGGIRNGD